MWKSNPDIRIEGPLLTCKSDNPSARYLKQFSAEFPHFEMWKFYPDVQREGALLTCKLGDQSQRRGTAYRQQFTSEFPHFEVVILETGGAVGLGVVDEDYDTSNMPGWYKESVGYHTDDGKIYHNCGHGEETKGPVMACRGDRIRCSVIFGNEKVNEGKQQVPVVFSLNGRKIISKVGEDQFFLDCDKPLYPYIGMMQGSTVLAKMLRDDKQALGTTSTSQDSDPGVLCVEHEVFILETGLDKLLGIGVVSEDYNTGHMPGWYKESAGYHTDDGKIYHNDRSNGRETKGPVMAGRGDRIRCTVMRENTKENEGKRRVKFALNGRKIITKEGQDQFFLDSDKPLYPYISMTRGSIVLAKMCPREVEDFDSKVRKSPEETNQNVNASLEELVKEVKKNRGSLEETNRKLEELVKDVKKNKDEINQKLDALLERLTDSKKD
ncbi:hypothetical protein ACROYT_G040157 [Oculina patagonica]